jgi:hypothetical protein
MTPPRRQTSERRPRSPLPRPDPAGAVLAQTVGCRPVRYFTEGVGQKAPPVKAYCGERCDGRFVTFGAFAALSPVAGVDYPTSLRQLVTMFPDDAACAKYLEQLRWPSGWVCSHCGVCDEPWRAARGLMCRHCRRQQRVLADTVLDSTKTSLSTWFTAAWMLTAPKNGVSAVTHSYLSTRAKAKCEVPKDEAHEAVFATLKTAGLCTVTKKRNRDRLVGNSRD